MYFMCVRSQCALCKCRTHFSCCYACTATNKWVNCGIACLENKTNQTKQKYQPYVMKNDEHMNAIRIGITSIEIRTANFQCVRVFPLMLVDNRSIVCRRVSIQHLAFHTNTYSYAFRDTATCTQAVRVNCERNLLMFKIIYEHKRIR